MAFKTVTVGIASDAIEQISKVSADRAVEELIWNAIDAEASRIEVIFYQNKLKGIERIVVSDNGHGILAEEAETIFKNIGGSPKRLRRRSPNLDRPYHGKEGKGRYKAFSLGRHVEWHSRTLANGTLQTFAVELDSSKLRSARIGSPEPCNGAAGCDVIISGLHDAASALRHPTRLESLVYRLAPYLIANPGIRIYYDGELLDVSQTLTRDETLPVELPGSDDADPFSFRVRVLEWSKPRKPSLFLCDDHGVSLDEVSIDVKRGRFSFSAYILSDRIRELHDADRLALGDLNSDLHQMKEAARDTLQDYFRRRHAEEAKNVADRIRQEGIYPYSQQPKSPVEKAEQQVFDICAATIHEFLPGFENADKNSRRFTYRILREALESNPTNVSLIFKEVLKLTEEQQADLVHLLGRTSLGAIIHTAKTVSDRLAFINGLEQILHDKTIRKHLKERTQLHRILVEELWIFGDEYTLGADDVSLKSVLSEHRSILGLPDLDSQVPKAEVADLDDIPDLLLWRQYLRGRKDEYEHLVIELKRPTVKISLEEIHQVKRYATKVLENKHFDKQKTRWTFIALSDGIAQDAEEDVSQRDRQPGHVASGKHHDIWVRTWSEVIQEAKIRLHWLQERLELAVSDNSEGMSYLRGKYAHLLPSQVTAPQGGTPGNAQGDDHVEGNGEDTSEPDKQEGE